MVSKWLAALAIGVAAPAMVQAAPVKWTLTGSFTPNRLAGTAGGSFIYDADTGAFSDIDLTTSTGRTYTQFLAESTRGVVFLQSGVTSGFTTALMLADVFLSELTNAGGDVIINPSSLGYLDFAEFSCTATTGCAGGFGGSVTNWNFWGAATSKITGVPVEVPEPASMVLVALAAAGLATARRRRA